MESLEGKLLLAMPGLIESTFAQSVVLLCAHSADGAMGLIINKTIPDSNFMELADNIDLTKCGAEGVAMLEQLPVHMGGPVEQERGFVLHDRSYAPDESSLMVPEHYCLTATIDVLQDIADGKGPRHFLLALGYAGWGPGQLESEITRNGWLHCDADETIVFHPDPTEKYRMVLARIGIDPMMLSASAGHG